MVGKTLTRAGLGEAIYREIGVSRNESIKILETVIDEISHCLEAGTQVKLSRFGSFSVRHKNPRQGRNPKTGEAAVISARRVLVFKPSQILKEKINS